MTRGRLSDSILQVTDRSTVRQLCDGVERSSSDDPEFKDGTNVGPGTAESVEAAALRLFATRGYEATGIRDIAREAGISVSSLYHYMNTKEDLLVRPMRTDMQVLIDGARYIVESTRDPVEQVKQLVSLHVGIHARFNLRAIVGDTELRSLSEERRREIVGMRDRYETTWRQVIVMGSNQGRFRVRDVNLVVLGLLQMYTGVTHWYSASGRLTLEEIIDGFIDMTLGLLRVAYNE